MRKTIVALVVIGLVWVGSTAWPLYELTVLVRAIDARDQATLAQHVNCDRVRVSLTEQVMAAYVRRSGINAGPFGQQAVIIGRSIADPIVTQLFRPKAISASLPSSRKSRVVSVLTAQRWTKRWPPRVRQVPLVVAKVDKIDQERCFPVASTGGRR